MESFLTFYQISVQKKIVLVYDNHLLCFKYICCKLIPLFLSSFFPDHFSHYLFLHTINFFYTGSSELILSSDHRPVFSSFNVGITSEFVQTRGSLAELSPVQICFTQVEAQVITHLNTYVQ